MRVRDAGVGLKRALVQSAEQAGCPIEVDADDFTRWASATFVGGKHVLKFWALRCAAFDAWLSRLPELDLAIPGHLVADIGAIATASAGGRTTVHLEALTVAEAA